MSFDEKEYKELKVVSLGQVNGWKGECKMIAYQYKANPVSVKVVIGDGKYQAKLIGGMPLATLKGLIPDLTKFIEDLEKPRVVRRKSA